MVGTTTYYLHQDALGSTRLVTTSSVTIKFSSNYVPYGNNYGVTGKEVFMYTGKPSDSATGLYYYGARYYDDSIGRFVTRDSIAGALEDPLSQNKYIYARDNPERYVDPNGHMYVGRMLTDSDDPTFMATLVSTTAPGGQTVYLAPTTTSTTYVGGSTVTTSTTTFVGTGGSVVSYTATSRTTRGTTGTVMTTTGFYTVSGPKELGPGGAVESTHAPDSSSNVNWDKFWAVEFVATVDILSVGAVAATRGVILIPPFGWGIVPADVRATRYVLAGGDNVNLNGAVGEWIGGWVCGFSLPYSPECFA